MAGDSETEGFWAQFLREHGIVDALAEAGVKCSADKAYRGAGGTVGTSCWAR